MLIAMNALVEIGGRDSNYRCPVSDFITGYKTNCLKEGEYIRAIVVPKPDDAQYDFLKVSKRFEDDISTVLLASKLRCTSDVISEACFAFGGMAATPKRAASLEKALVGSTVNAIDIDAVSELLGQDFEPMSDVRASAAYRLNIAKGLVTKVLKRLQGEDQNLGIWSEAG